jgi:hypothetical protein
MQPVLRKNCAYPAYLTLAVVGELYERPSRLPAKGPAVTDHGYSLRPPKPECEMSGLLLRSRKNRLGDPEGITRRFPDQTFQSWRTRR